MGETGCFTVCFTVYNFYKNYALMFLLKSIYTVHIYPTPLHTCPWVLGLMTYVFFPIKNLKYNGDKITHLNFYLWCICFVFQSMIEVHLMAIINVFSFLPCPGLPGMQLEIISTWQLPPIS